MKSIPRTSLGIRDVVQEWDGRDFLARLNLIMDHVELFWSLRLITASEIAAVDAMNESAREYIVEREDHPLFTSIDLKKTVAAKYHGDKLKAALQAVFK